MSVSTYPGAGLVSGCSSSLLRGEARGAAVAEIPPIIDFLLVRTEPYGVDFGGWGGIVTGPRGRYYLGLANHGGENLLVSYEPRRALDEVLCATLRPLYRPEGRWRGRPDVHPETGWVYLLGFFQGEAARFNVNTRACERLGRPDPGHDYRDHLWDWRRDRLYGADGGGRILVYDTAGDRPVFAGIPTEAATGRPLPWPARCGLLDRSTGRLYAAVAGDNALACYDPAAGTFTLMRSRIEEPPAVWSDGDGDRGIFWLCDRTGNIYRFDPARDRLEPKGRNWAYGVSVAFIAQTRDGRRLYYCPSGEDSSSHGLPVIQYETETGRKKVLAFLHDYLLDNYRFKAEQILGGVVNDRGDVFTAVCNGLWQGERRAALLTLHIPERELLPA